MGDDHYRTLVLQPDASKSDIRNAYFRLAHRYHPDHYHQADAAGRAAAAAMFRKVKEAYEVLHDEARRSHYDRLHGGCGGGASSSSADSDSDWASVCETLKNLLVYAKARRGASSATAADWDALLDLRIWVLHQQIARARANAPAGASYSSSNNRHRSQSSSSSTSSGRANDHGTSSSSSSTAAGSHGGGSQSRPPPRPQPMQPGRPAVFLFRSVAVILGGSALIWYMSKRDKKSKDTS